MWVFKIDIQYTSPLRSKAMKPIFMARQFHFLQIHLHNMHYIKQCAECCWIIYQALILFHPLPWRGQRGLICVRLYRHRATLWDSPYIFRQYRRWIGKKISRLHIGFRAALRAPVTIFSYFPLEFPLWKYEMHAALQHDVIPLPKRLMS